MSELRETDPEVYNAIKGEEERERSKIVLIASENYVSQAVLEAQGSVACDILKTWLDTGFEGGRHQTRLDKIRQLEKSIKE